AGGVRAEDGARPAQRLYFFEQGALDLGVFRHGLDDPLAVLDPAQMVFEVSDRDHAGGFGDEERGRAGLQGGVQAGLREAVPDLSVLAGMSFGLIFWIWFYGIDMDVSG